MPAAVHNLLDRFQLFRVPSLPPLILQELSSPSHLPALLEEDVYLFAKVLGSFRQQGEGVRFNANALLAAVGENKVEELISQTALQNSFAAITSLRLNFFKLHWRQSFLGRVLARELAQNLKIDNVEQAAFAGQFLNIGELVLEGLFSEQYRLLHESVNSEAQQVAAEIDRLGFSHAEIGAELLRRWGLNSFICDAVHYHQEGLEQVLDASNLVKVCWLANLMSSRPATSGPVYAAGESLFGLERDQLVDIHTSALKQLHEKAEELRIIFSSEIRLPLQGELPSEIAKQDESLELEL
ncbi:HDOD domain-containing protein, partial [Gammaproteobacteria bacterium]|nr:HDOD domain-containing protein [Gammaproteobacteria bacterium]